MAYHSAMRSRASVWFAWLGKLRRMCDKLYATGSNVVPLMYVNVKAL